MNDPIADEIRRAAANARVRERQAQEKANLQEDRINRLKTSLNQAQNRVHEATVKATLAQADLQEILRRMRKMTAAVEKLEQELRDEEKGQS